MEGKVIKLKVCGIRSIEEIEELKSLDIDYFGCIFAKSPRQVSVELAREITEIAHKAGKKTVGVFVNESVENILEIVAKTGIDCVQLHGSETPEYDVNSRVEVGDRKNKGLVEEIINLIGGDIFE